MNHFPRFCSQACSLHLIVCTIGFVVCGLTIGCGKQSFAPNELAAASFLETSERTNVQKLAANVSQEIEKVFGTPDEPLWPADIAPLVDMEQVRRAAGPVGRAFDRVERGLYRKHCVQCHGITGDGAGPAAMVLSPYPRDFRRGTFKFKSTKIGQKPLKADLIRTLEQGIPGTSMPSFKALRKRPEFEKDIEAIVEYVIYLSVRGEVERRLIRTAALDEVSPTAEEALIIARQVVESWEQARENLPTIPEVPTLHGEELSASIDRGRTLFASDSTACFKCHGIEGKGDGISQDYDEWTKDWTIRVGIDPSKKEEWQTMKPFGALKPVVNRSRNLHLGGLRGGNTIPDIARRIVLGIDGTPMPAASVNSQDQNSLTLDELYDLVRYVASITGADSSAEQTFEEPLAKGNTGEIRGESK